MGSRRTVAAVVVLAGLFAFLYFYEYKGEAGRELAEEERSRALSLPESIGRVRIERPGGIMLEIVRTDDAWHLAAPITTRADDRMVEAMLSSLRFLKRERMLDGVSAAERGTFGLDPPLVRVALAGGGDPAAGAPDHIETTIEIGGTVPVSGGRYAVRPGADGVLLVAGNVAPLLEATADRLRQKKMIGMDAWMVRRVTLKTRESSVTLERSGDSWRLTGAETIPADGVRVDAIVADLTAAEASGFADEAPSPERLASFGLTPESGVIEVEVAGEKTAVRALLGRAGEEGSSWARRSDMDAVMILAGGLRESIAGALSAPEILRDPRPARFNRFALSQLTVAEKIGAQGTRVLFKDAASSWHLGSEEGPALPSERVNAILDALEILMADRWAGAQDEAGMQEALSIILTERDPAAGEETVEPLTLTIRVPAGAGVAGSPAMKESIIASSIASPLYVVPGSGVSRLIDAVTRLEEPLPAPEDAVEGEPAVTEEPQ